MILPALVVAAATAPLWTLVSDRTYAEAFAFSVMLLLIGDLVQVAFFEWRPWRRPPEDRGQGWQQ